MGNLVHGLSGTCTDTLNAPDADEAPNSLDGTSTNSSQLAIGLLLSGGLFLSLHEGSATKQ